MRDVETREGDSGRRSRPGFRLTKKVPEPQNLYGIFVASRTGQVHTYGGHRKIENRKQAAKVRQAGSRQEKSGDFQVKTAAVCGQGSHAYGRSGRQAPRERFPPSKATQTGGETKRSLLVCHTAITCTLLRYTGNLHLRNWKILKVQGRPSAELRGG